MAGLIAAKFLRRVLLDLKDVQEGIPHGWHVMDKYQFPRDACKGT